MQRTQQGRNVTKSFDSFDEYLTHAAEPHKGGLSRKQAASSIGSVAWSGTASFDEAMRLARNGWAEGLAMIESLTAKLESVTGSLVAKQVVQWDVAGDFADAGLYSAGVPECMGSFHEEIIQGAGKCVRILYNIATSSGSDAATMMKRGAAVVALVDALESAGRSCEIEVASVQGSMHGQGKYTLRLPIKAAGEPVELDRLAFILAHPSSYRRVMFSAFENETDAVREGWDFRMGGNYGSPQAFADSTADIVVPEISLFRSSDDTAALAWIRAELQRQGCTMEETPA